MIARRRFKGLDSIMDSVWKKKCGLVPAEKLIEKRLQSVVAHNPRIGIRLAPTVKNGGRCLVDAVHLSKREILVDGRIQRAALDKSANLGHLRWGEDRGNRAIHVAGLFPLLLILKERLLHRFDLAELSRSTGISCSHARMRMHRERKIPMDQVDLAIAYVVVHDPAI